jgi:uncharacterized protein (DUF58 family)
VSLEQLRALELKARGFSFLPGQPPRSVLTGRHASRLRGRGLNFEELRHYQRGDDIRRLDWKATRRSGRPMVRVYTEERERSVLLLVDQRVSMFFGSVARMKSVVAAELAALAAWRVLASADRIGALIFDDRHCHHLPERRSRRAVMALLGQLVRSNAALRAGLRASPGQLDTALQQLARRVAHDALVIYIGDGHGWSDRSTEVLQRLRQHNDVLALMIEDPAERVLPAAEEWIVSDGELQISVHCSRAEIAGRFHESGQRQRLMRQHSLARLQVPVIDIDTVREPADQLLAALGAGSR